MNLREELVQVAAVAIAIVEDLDHGSTWKAGRAETALIDVIHERQRQEKMWGPQHHSVAEWLSILGEEVGEAFKAANDEVIFPKESNT